MDRANEILAQFKREKPKRHIVFMDGREQKHYCKDYINFNLELLSRCLAATDVRFEVLDSEWILIRREGMEAWELFEALLKECAAFTVTDEERGGVRLSLRVPVCSLMAVCSGIFDKYGTK